MATMSSEDQLNYDRIMSELEDLTTEGNNRTINMTVLRVNELTNRPYAILPQNSGLILNTIKNNMEVTLMAITSNNFSKYKAQNSIKMVYRVPTIMSNEEIQQQVQIDQQHWNQVLRSRVTRWSIWLNWIYKQKTWKRRRLYTQNKTVLTSSKEGRKEGWKEGKRESYNT